MGQLVHRKFSEWTEGLDSRQAMVSIFYHIRDMPYELGSDPAFLDPQRGPEVLLEKRRGSCGPKHHLLAAMFRMLNVNVIYSTIPFFWDAQDIRYPPALRDLAAGLPVAYHLACRVQIGCRWALVDATWDPPLGKAGFPVNTHWDGYAETKCAIKPLKAPPRPVHGGLHAGRRCKPGDETEPGLYGGEKDHWEAEDRERYYQERLRSRPPDGVKRTGRFFRELNAWMEEVRGPGYPAGTD